MDAIDKINIRLKAILAYVKRLKKYQGMQAAELRKDRDKAAAVERYLQLTIEAVIDIANLLNAEYRFRQAEDARESIIILGEEKILNKNFSNKFSSVAGFRNILVHDYLKIDYDKVAEKLNQQLGDFEHFCQSVAKYLS